MALCSLSVRGNNPKPPFLCPRRACLGQSMQDREGPPAHHLSAILQCWQTEIVDGRSVQTPKIDHAVTRQRLTGRDVIQELTEIVGVTIAHRPSPADTAGRVGNSSVDQVAMMTRGLQPLSQSGTNTFFIGENYPTRGCRSARITAGLFNGRPPNRPIK